MFYINKEHLIGYLYFITTYTQVNDHINKKAIYHIIYSNIRIKKLKMYKKNMSGFFEY